MSSSKQKERGDLDRQVELLRKLLRKHADEKGYIIVDIITDVVLVVG